MVFMSKFSIYFNEVIRRGSIRKAAEHLHIAASAVDRQILNAEEVLGIQLFDRTPGGLRPTATGEMVAHQIARWIEDEASLSRHMDALRNARGGEVKIAVADGLAVNFIPSAIERLHARIPGLRFKITVATATTTATLLRSGECDIAVTFDPPSFAGLSVEAEALSRLGVLVPFGHPLTEIANLCVSDCVGYPIIAPDPSTALWQLLERLLEGSSLSLDVILNSNNIALLCDMVKKKIGIALMRDLDAFGNYRDDEAVFLMLKETKVSTQKLSLIVASGRVLFPGANLVLQEFKNIFLDRYGNILL